MQRLAAALQQIAQLREAGDYPAARALLGATHAETEAAFGAQSLEVAAALNQLGMLGEYDGRFDEAAAAYHRALRITEATVGANHPLAAALYLATGRSNEAERLYLRARALKEKLLGAAHPDVAMTLNNLAVLLKKKGRYAEAARLYQRALAIFSSSLGPEHPKVITCQDNL